MSHPAGNPWRASAAAFAMLLPALALSACAKSDEEAMAAQLAAAEAAAAKAVAAQKAAEHAAAIATSVRPAPPPEPTMMVPDEPSFDSDDSPPDDAGYEGPGDTPA